MRISDWSSDVCSSDLNDMIDRSFSGPLRDYFAPFGFGGANGVFALHTRLYMEKYGVSAEDFGRLAIAQRNNALLNPNALFKEALTMRDYLEARAIADPLRLYDCVLPCCGGDAIVDRKSTRLNSSH